MEKQEQTASVPGQFLYFDNTTCFLIFFIFNLLEDDPEAVQPKKKLTLTFEDYKNLSNLLVIFMRREEQQAEEGGEDSKEKGVSRSEVVAWYLENVQDQIETEEELVERKALVEKVIDRLIYHVSKCFFLCVCYFFL